MRKERIMAILFTLLLPLVLLSMVIAQEETEPKGEQPIEKGEGVTVANGGGDTFGYSVTDSIGGSCSVQFVDISQTGTVVVAGDDESTISPPPNGISSTIVFSVPFMFYGHVYTEIVMASNGYLSTDPLDDGPDFTNDCPLPVTPSTPATTGGRIYPLHNDFVLDNGAVGLHQEFEHCPRPDRYGETSFCSVFQWEDAHFFGDVVTFTVQAILYHNTGEIVYQYDGRNVDAGLSSTTGIQSPPNDLIFSGLTYACNITNSVQPNSAVCITPPTPELTLFTTVSTDSATCSASPSLRVNAGTEVYYCFTATNTGEATFTNHTISDSEHGLLLGDTIYGLYPGAWATYLSPISSTIAQSVVNQGFWEASYNELLTVATHKATVVVNGPEATLACNSPAINFNDGLPSNWLTLATINQGVVWGDLPSCNESNYTGRDGNALCSSSDAFGVADYDAEVWSNPIDLPNEPSILLNYWANYQDFSNGDYLDLEISTNGGVDWTTLLSWGGSGDSYGDFFGASGQLVSVDLSDYAGNNGGLLRWRYYNDDPVFDDGYDWYAQIDDVSLYCGNYHLYLPTATKQ